MAHLTRVQVRPSRAHSSHGARLRLLTLATWLLLAISDLGHTAVGKYTNTCEYVASDACAGTSRRRSDVKLCGVCVCDSCVVGCRSVSCLSRLTLHGCRTRGTPSTHFFRKERLNPGHGSPLLGPSVARSLGHAIHPTPLYPLPRSLRSPLLVLGGRQQRLGR